MEEIEELKSEIVSLRKMVMELLPQNQIKKYDNIPSLFPSFAKWYLDNFKKANIEDRTYIYYNRVLRNHFNLNKPISEISLFELQSLLNSCPKSRIKEVTYVLIREVFKKAHELKMVNDNIAVFLQKGKIKRTKVEAYKFKDQVKIFENINKLQSLDKIRVFVMLFCGLRPSEVLELKKVNLYKKWLYVEGTKTVNAKRQVPISKNMYELLNGVPKEKFLKCDLKKFRKRLYKFFETIKIKGTLYMFRHTFATNMHNLGHVQKNIQHYMGHASSVLTMDVYTSFDPDLTKKNLVKLYSDWYPKAK